MDYCRIAAISGTILARIRLGLLHRPVFRARPNNKSLNLSIGRGLWGSPCTKKNTVHIAHRRPALGETFHSRPSRC